MQTSSIFRHWPRVLASVLVAVAGILPPPPAWAGETASSELPAAPPAPGKVPPSLLISIGVGEPESLPAASEALERLMYDLSKRRRLFSRVSAGPRPAGDGVHQLHLDIRLHRRDADQANLKSWWPPITERGGEGTRILFSGQLPLEARLTLTDLRTKEVRAEKTLVVQSKGRTITAGTTDVAGIIIARDIKKYLYAQHRSGTF